MKEPLFGLTIAPVLIVVVEAEVVEVPVSVVLMCVFEFLIRDFVDGHLPWETLVPEIGETGDCWPRTEIARGQEMCFRPDAWQIEICSSPMQPSKIMRSVLGIRDFQVTALTC